MSNSIWHKPTVRPVKDCIVVWQNPAHMSFTLPRTARKYMERYNCERWATLDDLIAQADKAERLEKEIDTGECSDGHHTFNELYYHRMCLFSIIVKQNKNLAWKSKLHSDGTMFDNYFIVGIDTPNGQATYHYHIDHWDMFDCVELPNAPEWDGHTADDALKRLLSLTESNN